MAAMHEWEEVADEHDIATHRMKVPGGWLYRHTFHASDEGDRYGQCMVFVPGPHTFPVSA